MKTVITLALKSLFFLLFIGANPAFAQFSGGSGTEGDPYQVATVADLDNVRNYLASHFIMTANIDLTTATGDPSGAYWNGGAGWRAIGADDTELFMPIPFTGSFDGNGHTILGLHMDQADSAGVGLFKYLGSPGAITNVGLAEVDITGFTNVGGLIGSTVVDNPETDPLPTVDSVFVTGSVTGGDNVGGVIGNQFATNLSHVWSTATVVGTGGFAYYGGLVGYIDGGSISESYATGTVTESSGFGAQVGGLVGGAGGGIALTISSSFATGAVTGYDDVAGLVGAVFGGVTITNSYATGSVSGDASAVNLGGLVGFEDDYTMGSLGNIYTSSYWDSTTTGQGSSRGGTGKTTAEMQTQGTFSGWDFSNTWEMDGYPALRNLGFGPTNFAPTASNLVVSNDTDPGQAPEEGDALSVSYDYNDVEGDLESGTTFQWYRADDGAGTNAVAISGAFSDSYTVGSADAGKFLRVDITPNDGTDAGATVSSSYVEVVAGNAAPTVSTPILDIIVDEDAADSTIDLTSVFSDAEQISGELTFSVGSNNNSTLAIATVDNTTDLLTLSYLPDSSGTADITIQAEDNGGLTAQDSFTITVNTVNDAPVVVSAISDITVNEEGAISDIDLTAVFRDVEQPAADLSYFVVSNTNSELVNLAIDQNTNLLSFTLSPDTYGEAEVVVGAVDEEFSSVSDTVNITVNPVALQLTLLSDRPDTLSVYPGFTDTLRFTAQDANANSIISDNDLTWTVTNDYGLTIADPVYDSTTDNWYITFNADDSESAVGTLSIEVQYTEYENLGQTKSVVLDPRGNRPFITTWDVSGDNMSVTFPTTDQVDGKDLSNYDFRIDWGNGESEWISGAEPTVTKAYTAEGTKTVKISGNFPYLSGTKVLFGTNEITGNMQSIAQWGDIEWESMKNSFTSITNLTLSASDVPDLSQVTSLEGMFSISGITTPDISGWDVSGITNMEQMFLFAVNFNSDISSWNVGNVQNMNGMFTYSQSFNGDIGNWNVASVDSMLGMFANAAAFDQNLADWDISQVVSFDDESQGAGFMNGSALSSANYDSLLTGWGAQTIQPDLTISFGETQYSLDGQFGRHQLLNAGWTINDGGLAGSPFITTWRTATPNETVTIPTGGGTDIADYDFQISWGDGTVERITGDDPDPTHTYAEPGDYQVNIIAPTYYLKPDQDGDLNQLVSLDQWGGIEWQSMNNSFAWARNMEYKATDVPDLSNVESMAGMFFAAEKLNGDFSGWNTSNVTDMSFMFDGASIFNGNISTWDVSKVTNMREMFQNADSLNQDLSSWNVSTVTNMQGLFQNAPSFNGDVSAWNTGAVTNMFGAFAGASGFNQDVSGWDVSNVTDFGGMFLNAAKFDQDISDWDITSATRLDNGQFGFLQGTSFSQQNYDMLLHKWNQLANLPENLSLNVGTAKYGPASAAHGNLTGFKGWTLTDGGRYNMFISIWEVTSEQPTIQLGAKGGDQISDFDFTIDWGDGTVEKFTGDAPIISHTYTEFGTKNIRIAGVFPEMNASVEGATIANIRSVVLWGEIQWESMASMFAGADILEMRNLDTPDLSYVTSMERMFLSTNTQSSFNSDISDWEVSGIANMELMFAGAKAFNQDISGWDVGSVTNMGGMFASTTAFDQNLGNWNIRNVEIFDYNGPFGPITVPIDIGFMLEAGLSTSNYDSTLIGWAEQVTTNEERTLHFGNSTRSIISRLSYNSLTDLGWTITDGGSATGTEFTTRWQTTSPNETVTIPTKGGTEISDFDFTIDWGDGTVETYTGDDPDPSHTYAAAGTYTVMIGGVFTKMEPAADGDLDQLVSLESWGSVQWESMTRMFAWARNMEHNATDVPDLSNVSSLAAMFFSAEKVNADLNEWNTSNITDMSFMFDGATAFNGDINGWNTSNVTTMRDMFQFATSFNQDISGWDVSKVTDLRNMLNNASAFNQNLGDWQIGSVELMQAGSQGFLEGTALSIANYDSLLIKWSEQTLPMNQTLDVDSTKYSRRSVAQRQKIIDDFNWTIVDGGLGISNIDLIVRKDRFSVEPLLIIDVLADDIPLSENDANFSWTAINLADSSSLAGFIAPTFNADNTYWELTTRGLKLNYDTGVNFNVSVNVEIPELSASDTGDDNVELFNNFFFAENGVTVKAPNAAINEQGFVIIDGEPLTHTRRDRAGLDSLVSKEVLRETERGIEAFTVYLNSVELITTVTTGITDMSGLFKGNDKFNQPIGSWDVSNVTNMEGMFESRVERGWFGLPVPNIFNQDISQWDVSNVTNMQGMFFYATSFNQDISDWDVSKVTNMAGMFRGASKFNQPIGKWGDKVKNVKNMNVMFNMALFLGITAESEFDQPLNEWNVSSVQTMAGMFQGHQKFNQPIGDWDVSSVQDMRYMFQRATNFNQPIGDWDVSSVQDMQHMFDYATNFNQPIGNWDVSSVQDMQYMFSQTLFFDQPIGSWNVSNVERMDEMFEGAISFNQPIGSWNVSKVWDFGAMFAGTWLFNQDISSWDMSSAQSTNRMFDGALSFNNGNAPRRKTKTVDGVEVATTLDWDVSNVTKMAGMFQGAESFNQDISSWDVSNVKYFDAVPEEDAETPGSHEALAKTSSSKEPAGNGSTEIDPATGKFANGKGINGKPEITSPRNQNSSDLNQNNSSDAKPDSIAGFLVGSGLSSENASKMFVEWSKRELQDGVSINIGAIELDEAGTNAMKALREANNMIVAWGGQQGVDDEPQFEGLPNPYEIRTEDTRILKLWDYVSDVATPDNELEFKFSIISDSVETVGFDNTNGELAITARADADTFYVAIQVANNENIVSLDTLEVRTDPNFITSAELMAQIPEDFKLHQNYPNPFNPSTIIRYGVPQSSEVRLEVFDMLGRKVATLVNGERQRAGWHQVNFDASRLASGMYLYRIVAGKYVQTRKMMLIK